MADFKSVVDQFLSANPPPVDESGAGSEVSEGPFPPTQLRHMNDVHEQEENPS